MRYLMLYRPGPDSVEGGQPDPQHMAEMGRLIEDMTKAGVLVATEGLRPRSDCARVTLSAGAVTVSDAPERIAGYALVNADSKAAAIASAEHFLRIAGDGTCEIRQVMQFGPTPA